MKFPLNFSENIYGKISMSVITLTFAEAGENNVGNEIIGHKANNGYNLNDLQIMQTMFPSNLSVIHDLRNLYPGMESQLPEAYILIVKNPCPHLSTPIYNQLILPESQGGVDWDKKYLNSRRNIVQNKNARHNLLFADLGSTYKRLPTYEIGNGTIYNYKYFPQLNQLFDGISNLPNGPPVVIEANYYYDLSKTYIKPHGDVERRKVIGFRLGNDLPLYFQWYNRFEPVGNKYSITLQHGDLYVMSEKAVGNDWKSSSIYTLRHSAGHEHVLYKYSKKK